MRKEEVVFFGLFLLVFILVGATIIFNFKSITGFVVLNQGGDYGASFSNSQSEANLSKLQLFTDGESEKNYKGVIFDAGEEVIFNKIEWVGDAPSGRILYGFKEGKYVYTYDEGASWFPIDSPEIISRIENAKVKGDLVDKYETNMLFNARACFNEDCSDSDFSEINPSDFFLRGKYFQYSIEFVTTNSLVTPKIDKVVVKYIFQDGKESEIEFSDFETSSFGLEDVSGE